jgi:hypothetical protein
MRISTFTVVMCVAAALTAASPAHAQSELVIDDFTAGAYPKDLTNEAWWVTEHKTGPASHIVGGVRQTSFIATQGTPPFGQSTSLRIGDGSMVISGGYKSYFGLYLGYGYDAFGGFNSLNLDLSGDHDADTCPDCDRFRIDFDGSDSELGYLMEVYDWNGNVALMNGPESLAGRILPFHIDFPFADFEEDPAHPVDWHHIDFVFVLFQTGAYLGGHDFAVTKITAVPK